MTHAVHVVRTLWVGVLLENAFCCAFILLLCLFRCRFVLCHKDFWVPVSMNLPEIFVFLIATFIYPYDFTFHLAGFSWYPTSLGELEMAFKVRLARDPYLRWTTDVNVRCTNDQVMTAYRRWSNLVLLTMILEFYVCFELLGEVQRLSCEFGMRLLIVPDHKVRLLSSDKVCSYRWMVRNLLRYAFYILVDQFVGLTQERIERLGCRSFTHCHHWNRVCSYIG